MKLITIYGIRRSGNHAIANWIISHFKSGCYINDANKRVHLKSNWLPCFKKNIQTNLDKNPEIIIIGIENRLNRQIHSIYLNHIKDLYNLDIDHQEICLIRKFPNLLASHLKAWGSELYHENMPKHWSEYIDFTNKYKDEIYKLIYDFWLDNETINEIALNIGFTNKNLGIEQIPHYGGGSSFGEKTINRDNLKNRWKNMLNNDRFLTIMKKFDYWNDHENIFGQDEVYKYFNN